jgi:hypothetical protein
LFDLNPAKQGSFVPGTRIPVLKPAARNLKGLGLVVIANPRYEQEISSELKKLQYFASNKEEIDVLEQMSLSTMEVISRCLLGGKLEKTINCPR